MRKALFMALFILACAPLALSQDYKRGEIGGGYSANWVDTQGAFSSDPNATGRDRFDGFYVNGGYNFSRYLGVQGEVSHNRKTIDFNNSIFQPVSIEGRVTEGLVGLKLQDNAVDTKVRPFARALVGVAHLSGNGTTTTSSSTSVTFSDSQNGFAAVLGGGIAFRLSRSVDFVTSADYNPIHTGDQTTVVGGTTFNSGGGWDNNLRVGVGLNFRFGGKK